MGRFQCPLQEKLCFVLVSHIENVLSKYPIPDNKKRKALPYKFKVTRDNHSYKSYTDENFFAYLFFVIVLCV